MSAGTIVLVGCGQMGSAMLRGWIAGNAASNYVVVEPAGVPDALLAAPHVDGLTAAGDLADALAPDAVVFAVKPQVIGEIVPAYRRFVRPQTVFMSIAAGTTIANLTKHLGDAAVVRVMPNTPAAIGRAISVACANQRVTAPQRELCGALLAAIGESAWVEEEGLIDPVTAVSGSGPAYVFLLIETLAQAGVKAGLSEDLALQLAKATVAGAGELARVSGESPSRLRENVTSPGGTTRAALDVLMGEAGMAELMTRAVAAATRRSRELAS